MALSILVDDGHNNVEKIIHFFIDEYDFVISKIEQIDGYPILKKALKEYYSDFEIYLTEIEPLKSEVNAFIIQFESDCPGDIKSFLESFQLLIGHALLFKRTIKFVGD
jgi:hypothetical protein